MAYASHFVRCTFAVAVIVCAARAAGDDVPAGGVGMDYGPFLCSSLDRDRALSRKHSSESREQDRGHSNGLAVKAVNVRLGGGRGVIAFDTELLRYAAGWTGGFLNFDESHLTTLKGSVPLAPLGELAFAAAPHTPGWSLGENDSFADPREHPFGPLPKSVGHYKGLYRHGERVVFRYTVGDAEILDMPGLVEDDGRVGFTRTVQIGPSGQPLALLVCQRPAGAAAAGRLPDGARWREDAYRVVLHLPARREPVTVKFAVAGPAAGADGGDALAAAAGGPEDLGAMTRGGPPLWPQVLTTGGQLGEGEEPYVVDSLTIPFDNPWQSWMRPSGFDFFPDGRIAFCTLNGDVWVVSGVDEQLDSLSWRRYAAGLYEPLGLKVVDDKVYVLCRDQITRLHDLNNDGEADFYENFNNDAPMSANYHAFAYDLHTDSQGNFHYTRTGHRISPQIPFHGAAVRVSPDGSSIEAYAAGFRAPNGMGIGPDDLITVSDNQGNWTPTSRINVVSPGGFYGYMPHVRSAGGPPRDGYDPPLCWIPHAIDNSGGSQVWAADPRWGPLAGQLLHTSYGKASLLLVLTQGIDRAAGLYNAGVLRLPLTFDSGVMRGRINPRDGQVYLCGLRGWQTAGNRDGALCRVRYTGKPAYLPCNLRVVPRGVELTFTQPLDPETANDLDSFGVEQWNYRWTAEYGSPEFSVRDPDRQGRDEVTVTSARLLDDGRTVFLEIPDLRPVMQMLVRYNLDAADGTEMADELYLTINQLPGRGAAD